MEPRILTLHPTGKTGVNILKRRYEQVREVILTLLREEGELTFTELCDLGVKELEGEFDGKPLWYLTTVKLDLEARGELIRVPGSKPQRIRLGA